MSGPIRVSTPSRLCLFGEHQDYLGLDVIAVAIDLRFQASIQDREDDLIHIRIRDSRLNRLDSIHQERRYETVVFDLKQPLVYQSKRDYLKSSVRVLQKAGYPLRGFDLEMDSDIPIGKGMCSSSTMVVVLIKALLEGMGHADKDQPERIAELAFQAEVLEFDEPGGRMDHYTSAVGGLVHLTLDPFQVRPLKTALPGSLILFDSLQQKKTTQVLASAKEPTLEAISQLKSVGIRSVRDFFDADQLDPQKTDLLKHLDANHQKKLAANIENHRLFKAGLALLEADTVSGPQLGALLNSHHAQLRDGLGLSTPAIEAILQTAMDQGAWGGKLNGSGGGGCCFVYADPSRQAAILEAVSEMGYPGRPLKQDQGVRRDDHERA